LLIIVALGQLIAAYCYVKYIQVFWPYFQKKEDHTDGERMGLVDAFKWLVYAAAAMYIINGIGLLIYGIIWGAGVGFGVGAII